jgi:methyl-accepting chemotaxis protein
MNKMSLKMKLGAGFGLLLLLMLAVAGTSYHSITGIDLVTDEAIGHLENKALANAIDSDVNLQAAAVRGYLLTGEDESLRQLDKQRKEFAEHMGAVEKILVSEEGKKAHARILSAEERYATVVDQEIELRRNGQTKDAVALAFNPQTKDIKKELASAIEDFQTLSDKLKDGALNQQNALVASS